VSGYDPVFAISVSEACSDNFHHGVGREMRSQGYYHRCLFSQINGIQENRYGGLHAFDIETNECVARVRDRSDDPCGFIPFGC
jgi:hypothetical protein